MIRISITLLLIGSISWLSGLFGFAAVAMVAGLTVLMTTILKG
jgi:uncharacterized membrane protein YuzA (DUF378 family)